MSVTYTLTRSTDQFDLNVRNTELNKQVTLSITPGKTTVLTNLPSIKRIDPRITGFLFWCVEQDLPLTHPVIVRKLDDDNYTIKYDGRGIYVTPSSTLDFIQTKFQEKMTPPKADDNPFDMAMLAAQIEDQSPVENVTPTETETKIVEKVAPTETKIVEKVTPTETKIVEKVAPTQAGNLVAELTIKPHRLTKDTLPASVLLQYGNIFGITIAWADPQNSVLVWDDKESAVRIEGTNDSFAGYEDNQHIYLEKDGLLIGQKKCIRVIEVDTKKPVTKKDHVNILFLMTKENVEDWFANQHNTDPSAVGKFLKDLVAKYSSSEIDDLLEPVVENDDELPIEELVSKWCKPYKKDGSGGLSIKELKAKAVEWGLVVEKGATRQDVTELIYGSLEGHEDEEEVDLTTDIIESWCKPYTKDGSGGLPIKELREKACGWGVIGTKRQDIKEELLSLIDTEDIDEAEVDLTADMIESWCKIFKKDSSGGLPIKELREKAVELGVTVAKSAKRQDIKEELLSLIEEPVDDTVTEEMVAEWCKPYKKDGSGGLPLKELRKKAEAFGVEGAVELDRSDIKEMFELFM